MKGPYTGEPGQDWRLGQGPYFFSGTPDYCIGELTLVNASDEKVKVRVLSTCRPHRSHKGYTPLDSATLSLAARIPPGEEVRARAVLQLDPHTPPGRYETALLCGTQKETVQIEILENQELSVEPRHFRVRGASGDTLSQTVRFTNLGNMPVKLGDVGMVWLRERNWIGRNLVYSLRETEPQDNYEDFANRLLHNLRDSIVSTASLQFEPKAETELAPGQQLERTLKIQLPPGVRKGRQYLGFIKINEYKIWMELYCNGAPGSSKRR